MLAQSRKAYLPTYYWRITAILRDSTVAVVVVVAVVRTRPRAIQPAMITMRKSIHGLPLVFYMGMGFGFAALRAAGAPLITFVSKF